MAASYPANVRSFTARVDNTDTVLAADVNNLQEEVAAIESTVGTAPALSTDGGVGNFSTTPTTYASVSARLANLEKGLVAINLRALDSAVVHNTGNETVAGNKTFSGTVTLTSPSISGFTNAQHTHVDAASGGALALVPSGAILDFAGAAAPSGYLLCGGQAVSRSTYAALFAAIGTAWGAGDGTTTFNVPDLRGRVAAGLDNMGGTTANRITGGTTLAGAGGAETHTLTAAQMPVHNHGVSDPGHSHGVTDVGHSHTVAGVPTPGHSHTLSDAGKACITHSASTGRIISRQVTANFTSTRYTDVNVNAVTDASTVGVGAALAGTTDNNTETQTYGTSGNGTTLSVNGSGTGITTQNTGSGGSHNILQPYALVNKIIKI